MTTVHFESLRLVYGEHVALDDVDLTVESGELLPILGPSGCGKTSLLRILAGLTVPNGGRVVVGDEVFNDPKPRVPAHRRRIGMVFQQLALWPHLSVEKNLTFGLHGPRDERRRRAGAMLDLVGLSGKEARRPDQLSGGEQQRVALARAVVTEPALLLLDEPLSSVDAMLREELLLAIRGIQRQLEITALYVTHDRGEAWALGRRIAVMERGRLVQTGTPAELHDRPVNRFVAMLTGAENILHAVQDGEAWRPLGDADPNGPAPEGAATIAVPPAGLAVASGDEPGLPGTVEASVFHEDRWLVGVQAGALHLKVESDREIETGAPVRVRIIGRTVRLRNEDTRERRCPKTDMPENERPPE